MDSFRTDTGTSTVHELKRFGFIFGPLAIAISLWQAWRGHWGHVSVFAPVGTYVLIMACVRPAWIFPVRWVLEKAFKLVMWVVTNTVLALCFYLVFTPIGLVMRLCGKDLLNQGIDKEAPSYWITRANRDFDPGHYKKQF